MLVRITRGYWSGFVTAVDEERGRGWIARGIAERVDVTPDADSDETATAQPKEKAMRPQPERR